MRTNPQMKIRLPEDVKAFLAAEANRNGSSQNSEVVRSIRDRMDRCKTVAGESLQAQPATVPDATALPGGASTHASA